MGKNRKNVWSLKKFQPKNSPERHFFRKNLFPVITPADPRYAFIAYLTFVYSPRDESGLPSSSDEEILVRVEDEEILCLEAKGLSVQVGTVLKSGIKDMLFYTRDPDEFLLMAKKFRDEYPQFNGSCEIANDAEWDCYRNFP